MQMLGGPRSCKIPAWSKGPIKAPGVNIEYLEGSCDIKKPSPEMPWIGINAEWIFRDLQLIHPKCQQSFTCSSWAGWDWGENAGKKEKGKEK